MRKVEILPTRDRDAGNGPVKLLGLKLKLTNGVVQYRHIPYCVKRRSVSGPLRGTSSGALVLYGIYIVALMPGYS